MILRRLPPWALWVLAGVAALLLAGGAAVLADAVLTEETADKAVSQEDLIGARIALEDRFPDAEKLTMGETFTHGDGKERAVCGRVDIEQADDGFDGEERFIFQLGELTLEETDGSDAVAREWRNVCEG
jgi:hypothetical protein